MPMLKPVIVFEVRTLRDSIGFGIVGATEVLWEVERAWEVLKIKGFCECFEKKKKIIGTDPFYRTFMWMILSRSGFNLKMRNYTTWQK
uniref:Uncharacterized protein n=1 Tax=Helianthus annuus TaxID=4232 RepID=A0A251VNZ3_HELAN